MPTGRSLDRVDHGDAARLHLPVQRVDVQHPRGEVIDVCRADAADVRGDGRDRLELGVPRPVDRLVRQRERRRCKLEEPHRFVGVEAAVRDRPIGQCKQLRREQRAAGQERVQSRLQLGREEPAVVGDQHRGEHAERVSGQLVGRDGTEGRAHHRHRGPRRLAQVVPADRVHAKRPEDPRDRAKFIGCADPDRAVPLGGHALDRAEPQRPRLRRGRPLRRSHRRRRRAGSDRRVPRVRTWPPSGVRMRRAAATARGMRWSPLGQPAQHTVERG